MLNGGVYFLVSHDKRVNLNMNRKQNSLMRFSRTERLAQLSEQEIVIERKKREIQAKIEAQKKKETEEAFKKLESSKESKVKKFGFPKKSWSRTENSKNKNDEEPEKQVKESLVNAFSNDGSFLDQFKKLSKSGLSSDNVDKQALTMEKAKEFNKYQGADNKSLKNVITENENNDASRDVEKTVKGDFTSISDKNQSPTLNSKTQLQLSSPTWLASQGQRVSVVPSGSNPGSLVPSHSEVVPNVQGTHNQTSAINRKNFFSNYSSTIKSMPHIQAPGKSLHSEPKNENEIRTSQLSYSSNSSPSLNCIQSPLRITPPNIPPLSPKQIQNILPPHKPSQDSELPKHRTESISLSLKAHTTKKLEAIPNPLDVDPSTSPKKSSFSLEKKEILNTSQYISSAPLSKSASDVKESQRVSSAFHDEDEGLDNLSEKCRQWAQLVARCGDDFEDSLRERNQNDPNLRFLFEKNSKEYLAYRKLVLKYRVCKNLSEQDSSLNTQNKYKGENSSNVKRTKFPHTTTSESDSCYLTDASTSERLDSVELKEENKYNHADEDEKQTNKTSELLTKEHQFSEEVSPLKGDNLKQSEMEIINQARTEERRKRKRKSRWGDVEAPSSLPVTGKINVQRPGKIPQPKSTLLSQLTRSDPGLIQYARQTFGSTNLSEEDWKKAEDHYKINLLYQDMVKKRAEVEKLERQGKFKYEYDSDEDTEGGTWEHKLRQQEMQATQLWAEELTRQAAGKHHIGDFLPPEELERFMEKYNAVKEGREPDLSDYKEYKLKQDNVGYRLLQKMGWNEGQGLGQDGSGIQNPVNKAITRHENQGLGVDRSDALEAGDDEYDAYRKRMMLAYRFRPNPLNNPRRPYY